MRRSAVPAALALALFAFVPCLLRPGGALAEDEDTQNLAEEVQELRVIVDQLRLEVGRLRERIAVLESDVNEGAVVAEMPPPTQVRGVATTSVVIHKSDEQAPKSAAGDTRRLVGTWKADQAASKDATIASMEALWNAGPEKADDVDREVMRQQADAMFAQLDMTIEIAADHTFRAEAKLGGQPRTARGTWKAKGEGEGAELTSTHSNGEPDPNPSTLTLTRREDGGLELADDTAGFVLVVRPVPAEVTPKVERTSPAKPESK